MTGNNHPSLEMLEEYASGATSEPVALALAVHLSSCSACYQAVSRLEALGGVSFGGMEPAHLDIDVALENIMEYCDNDDGELAVSPSGELPSALAARLPGELEELLWRAVARGVAEHVVGCSEDGYSAVLLRIRPGAKVPFHTHRGDEYTVVLKGSFRDLENTFLAGDFTAADETVRHSPTAIGDADCYCLAVTNAPLRLLSPLGRIVEPLIQMRSRKGA